METATNAYCGDTPVLNACWNRIGVQGDRSCPKLAVAVHCRNCAVFSDAGQRLFLREAPPEYLDERTQQLAEVDQSDESDKQSLLVFRLGPEWLAIEAAAVTEVVEPRAVHRVPHRTDRLLMGLVNIRGELHLCVSLRELLTIEAAGEAGGSNGAQSVAGPTLADPLRGCPAIIGTVPRERLLVTTLGGDAWVFPVDEVEGMHRVSAAAMEDLPHTLQKSPRYYSQALFRHKDARIGVLSPVRLARALENLVR
jgi:chemotaxis-related protein WspD